MMNTHDILRVACHEAKLQRRQWVFRLFVVFSVIGIALCHVILAGRGYCDNWKMLALPCSLPLMCAYLVSVVQSLFVIVIITDIPRREKREGALASIHARPLGNGDYTWGRIAGNLFLFVLVNLVITGESALFAILETPAPLGAGYYAFYFFTLTIPSLVFMAGLSLWLMRVVRLRYLALLLLMAFLGVSVFWLPYHFHGTWDFLASGVPNLFSDETGHTAPGNYLLHRIAFLLLGLGFLACSVKRMTRLPNDERRVKRYSLSGMMLVLTGLVCAASIEMTYRTAREAREGFRESFLRYQEEIVCRVLRHDIVLKQAGDKLDLASDLTLYNPTARTIGTLLLFLNPGLKVTSLETVGKTLSYQRDGQVIVINHPLAGGDSLSLRVCYAGRIDERFTDLHLPDDINENSFHGDRFFPTARRSAFVGDRFLLLPPACAWYPVAIPPVNPFVPVYSGKDLTHYRLAVERPSQKVLLSQGIISYRGDTTLFCPSRPLPGISLCGGDYESGELETGRLLMKLYTFRGHSAPLRSFDAVSPETVRMYFADYLYPELKMDSVNLNWYEPETRHLYFVETPLSFYVEANPGKVLSGLMEPGMVFLPEKGFGMNLMSVFNAVTGKEDKPGNDDISGDVVVYGEEKGDLSGLNMCAILADAMKWPVREVKNSHPLSRFFGNNALEYNPCYALSLFRESGLSIYSDEYPFIGLLFEQIRVDYKGNLSVSTGMGSEREQNVYEYLTGHSLKDIFQDREVNEAVRHDFLQLKKQDLLDRLTVEVPLDTFLRGLDDIYSSGKSLIRLDDFSHELGERTGIWLDAVLPEWFHARHEQYFEAKDWNLYFYPEKGEYGQGTFVLEGVVMNCGREAGMVSVEVTSDKKKEKHKCRVAPGDMKAFRQVYKGLFFYGSLKTGLSSNRPSSFEFTKYTRPEAPGPEPTAGGWTDAGSTVFSHDLREIVVDDQDTGFSFTNGDQTWLQRWFGKSSRVRYSMITTEEIRHWTPYVGQCYGDSVRGCYYKSLGAGNCTATWTTSLAKKGRFRVMAYVTRAYIMAPEKSDGFNPPSDIAYHYVIRYGEKEENVEVFLDKEFDKKQGCGWVTIGDFDFPAGMVSVILSDKGEDQRKEVAITADAVKWISIE